MALSDHLQGLRDVWASRMPITGALEIAAVAVSEEELLLAMPLLPNRNHKGTAFAGSLAALATLAGWSTLWLLTRDAAMQAHIVIQDSNIRYLRPVRSDATAHALVPDADTRERLLATYQRRGRARVSLEITLRDAGGETVALFKGRYVVHREELYREE